MLVALISACGGKSPTTATAVPTTPPSPASPAPVLQPVYVVLFTHVEDNTPAGALDSPGTRTGYLNIRTRLLEWRRWRAAADGVVASARLEDPARGRPIRGCGDDGVDRGVNVFRYLQDSLGVAIDPHSHEGSGYNYTDVAHLLGTLGVGGQHP